MVNKHCKHFRHEPYMTPNNYDLYFNPAEIPVNIPRENTPNLINRLQKVMPLSKKIHVNLETDSKEYDSNTVSISTRLKINNREVDFL